MADVLFLAPVALYAAAVVGVTLSVRSASDDGSYFFASKRLGSLPALLSVVSSETSVATAVVFPAAGLSGGYTLLWLLLGYIAGRSLVAAFYLRALYESSRLTIYQTMSANHRVLEAAYLLAKYMSGGVRYFIGGFALSQVLGGPPWLWILVVAACVAGYSLSGGLKAVVMMDQIQCVLIVGTGVFLCAYLSRFAGGGAAVAAPAVFEADWTKAAFSPVMLLAGIVLSIGSHGTDQDMLLRVLATKSLGQARRALVLSGFVAAALITLYLTVGYLLRFAAVDGLDAKSPLADFVSRGDIPLLRGVFLVLLAAAAMSSLDSTIHSTGAIWKSMVGSTRPGRVWSALSLCVMVGFAMGMMLVETRHPDFLSLAMGTMNYVNAGLIGIATVFTFFPARLTGAGAVLALASGFAVTATCDWAFDAPLPWTRTVLLAASAAFVMALLPGLLRRGRF